MTRAFVTAFCLWLVLGFVVWNVLFDRRVALAAIAFTREQTRNHQQGLPVVSIADGFTPEVRAAAVRATVWAGAVAAVGAALSLSAARSSRHRRQPPSR